MKKKKKERGMVEGGKKEGRDGEGDRGGVG